MLLAFTYINKIVKQDFVQSFVSQVLTIITERLLGMTEKETKEFDKDSLLSIFYKLRDFILLSNTDVQAAEMIEKIQINLATKFLRSTYLEKRLKGLNDIQQHIERVDARATLEQDSSATQIHYLKG
mmetsp:Transcript_4486/g.6717  ORF Transcript_4486/g.6717 Transcript_4486/m.6717 type:complete len:127 (-) Transcript_4486:6729-7109(-)